MNDIKNGIPQISVQELSSILKRGLQNQVLIDVREDSERAVNHISGSIHVPLQSLLNDQVELDRSKEIIIYCLVGGRSQRAAEHLKAQGFAKVKNVAGGIRTWIDEIDPSLPR